MIGNRSRPDSGTHIEAGESRSTQPSSRAVRRTSCGDLVEWSEAMRSFLLVVATWVVSSVRGADVFTAIGSDNVEQMKVHLRADPASLDRTGPGGQSPLMHAVLTLSLIHI